MAVLADHNAGFKGPVTTAEQGRMMSLGVRYAVMDHAHLRASAGTGDRVVKVTKGQAFGDGVLSTWNTDTDDTTLAGAPVTNGWRWDTLVARRTFTPDTYPDSGRTELKLLTGTVATGLAPGVQMDRGGTVLDQPLWLVRFNKDSSAPQEFIDLRTFAGEGGGLVATRSEVLQYLQEIGTVVILGDYTYVRTLDANGNLVWISYDRNWLRSSQAGLDAGLALATDGSLNLWSRDGSLVWRVDNTGTQTAGKTSADRVVTSNGRTVQQRLDGLAGVLVQSGKSAVNVDTGNFKQTGEIRWDEVYAAPPRVIVAQYISPSGQVVEAAPVSHTTRGFQLRVKSDQGYRGLVNFDWIAVGGRG